MSKEISKNASGQKVSSRNRNKNKNKALQIKEKEKQIAKENKIKAVLADESLELVDKEIEVEVYSDGILTDDKFNIELGVEGDDSSFIEIKPEKFSVEKNNKQSSSDKFNFVPVTEDFKSNTSELEEIYKYAEADTGEIVMKDFEDKLETISPEEVIPTPTTDVDINVKKHVSFEKRVITLLVIIIISFFVAGLFIFKAVTHNSADNVTYDEESKVQYSVCVSADNASFYYTDACLDENMEYLTNISENVTASFNYVVEYSKEMNSRLSYYAVSKINILNGKNGNVLHTTEDVLLERTSYKVLGTSAEFLVDVSIPFAKYYSYVNTYNKNYGVDGYATLEVDFYVDNGNVIKKVSTLEMPLSDKTFSIKKTEVNNTKQNMNVVDTEWESLNTSYALVGVIFVLFGLLAIIRLSNLVCKITGVTNLYQKKLERILREYDKFIVMSHSDYDVDTSKRLIKVTTFKELLDARNTLEKPIVYVRVNNVKSEFYVEDSETIYKYTIKEADFE